MRAISALVAVTATLLVAPAWAAEGAQSQTEAENAARAAFEAVAAARAALEPVRTLRHTSPVARRQAAKTPAKMRVARLASVRHKLPTPGAAPWGPIRIALKDRPRLHHESTVGQRDELRVAGLTANKRTRRGC